MYGAMSNEKEKYKEAEETDQRLYVMPPHWTTLSRIIFQRFRTFSNKDSQRLTHAGIQAWT
jgi:hypothetical protein